MVRLIFSRVALDLRIYGFGLAACGLITGCVNKPVATSSRVGAAPETAIAAQVRTAGVAATAGPTNPVQAAKVWAARDCPRKHPANQAEYARLEIEPTPPNWRSGAVWQFVEFADAGAVRRSMRVRLTDAPVKGCFYEDWRALDTLDGTPRPANAVSSRMAYRVKGRTAMLLLDSERCAIEDLIAGTLDDQGFHYRKGNGPNDCGLEDGSIHGVPASE
jgi:hypothetical protein